MAEPLAGLVDTAFAARLGSPDLAGLGVGLWPDRTALAEQWRLERTFDLDLTPWRRRKEEV